MTPPMPAFSGGCHTNRAVDDAYAVGGFPAVFRLPGGIYSARDAGCRAFIDRFPGTRYGEPPHLTHFLRCADNGYVNIVKGLTSFSFFRKRCAWTVYLRGLSDLPQSNAAESLSSEKIVMQIIALLRRAGAQCIIEGTPQTHFEKVWLGWFIQAGLYAGTEPFWDRGATDLWQYPCIVEERAMPEMGASVDGSKWPSTWRPFGKYDPAPMLLLSDRVPITPERVAEVEAYGWRCVPYCHQWKDAQGVKA